MYKQTMIALAAACMLAMGEAGAVGRTLASTVDFTIASQSLGSALLEVSAQTGMQVVTSGAQIRNLRTSGVSGRATVREALEKLLSGSGLSFKIIAENTIGLVRKEDSGQRSSDALVNHMRLAAGDEATAPSQAGGADSDGKDQVTVEGRREKGKPFADGNMDIPRAIDDPQPYYIFDAKTIERSGAINVEDFLKQRLTMNATAQTNGEISGQNTRGNLSSIDLRGLGADKTLILVNGRRLAGASLSSGDQQPDLNGIPMGSIDRIEVLPSSASGIYGGSAIGGVVNVILRRDYAGGEARATYDNTWNGNSPRRTVSLSYGLGLEGGKTHLGFNTAWSDQRPLLLRDRVDIFERNLAGILSRDPSFIYVSTNPWLGNLPNIAPSDGVSILTLTDGAVSLNSRATHIAAGTSATTSDAERDAGLLANAGQWNMGFPGSTQSPSGLLRPFGAPADMRSFHASFRRQMLPRWEVFADVAYGENATQSIYNPVFASLFVSASAPTNPFTTDVRVRVPDATRVPMTTTSENRSATLGTVAQLRWGWTGALDYTWSENRYDYQYILHDTPARTADLTSGALNPFVDTLRYPLNFTRYMTPVNYRGSNQLHGIALRGAGPLPALPWGRPSLVMGLEWRQSHTPENTFRTNYPITRTASTEQTFFARESTTESGYMEATVPLVKSGWLPGLRGLDLQLSGRGERYRVDTGTPSKTTYYGYTPAVVSYSTPNLNGQPFFSQASYTSNNYTLGLKYQPVEGTTVRISRATAFLPPLFTQLISDPPRTAQPNERITDPVTNDVLDGGYEVIGGGNPQLKPQNSRSLNAGIIWESRWRSLAGLRLNAEYYRIEQFDAIGSLGVQLIVDQEANYPGRVVRDGAGTITQVDASAVNLYYRVTEGFDLSADYAFDTSLGRFNLQAVESIILHLKNQYSQTQPEYEAVGFPSEGGAARYKTNATVSWERERWTAGWTARYFGSYKQYGAAGGPQSRQYYNGGPYSYYLAVQGGDTISSQTYHDLFIGYAFDRARPSSGRSPAAWLLNGLALQFSMRNVFDKAAPFDVYYQTNHYMSPYGDVRLRSYWLSAKLAF